MIGGEARLPPISIRTFLHADSRLQRRIRRAFDISLVAMAQHLHLAAPGDHTPDGRAAEPQAPIKVVLADDHAGMRRSLRLLLESESDLEVIGDAADITAAAERVRALRPRVLVIDFRMRTGVGPGLEVIRHLRAAAPDTAIVVVSMDRVPAFAQQAIVAGAIGFVLKDRADSDLPPAVRAAAHNEEYVSPAMASSVSTVRSALGNDLTDRETEVVRLVALGHTSQEIAIKLGISRRTVETHKARVYEKLRLNSRAELVAYALRRHLMGV